MSNKLRYYGKCQKVNGKKEYTLFFDGKKYYIKDDIKILITVPHANVTYADKTDFTHYADLIAESVAKELRKLLRKNGYTVFLHINDEVHRRVMDMNRMDSRHHPYRKELLNIILSNEIDLVLDIHSFPSYSERLRDYDTVIFNIPKITNQQLIKAVKRSMPKDERIVIVEDTDINDIVVQANENNVDALLIEFNEGSKKTENIKTLYNILSAILPI